MSIEITIKDVKSVLSTETAKSLDEITQEIYDGDVHCSECGATKIGYQKARESTREAVSILINRNRVVSTPDWDYKLTRKD